MGHFANVISLIVRRLPSGDADNLLDIVVVIVVDRPTDTISASTHTLTPQPNCRYHCFRTLVS